MAATKKYLRMLWHEVCEELGYKSNSEFGRGFRASWLDAIIGHRSRIAISTESEYARGYRTAQETFGT